MAIKLDHVSVFAPNNPANKILDDICCTFAAGTVTLLIGKTGSGKSTLLDVLAGLTEVNEGSVWYDQHLLWDGKRLHDAVRLKTGSVFQYPEHHLFARTVQGEFEYSLKPYHLSKESVNERIKSTMQTLNLTQDLLSQSPFVLSGGQKRRVSLGTTFATEPEWLFLDEPTSGLDPEAVHALIGYIKDWKERSNGGMVIATHDLDAFFPIADHVLVIHDGNIEASLSPHELCENPDVLIHAGVGMPSCLEVSLLLRRQGISAPFGLVPADKMAKEMIRELKQKNSMNQEIQHTQFPPTDRVNEWAGHFDKQLNEQLVKQHPKNKQYFDQENRDMPVNDPAVTFSSAQFIQNLDPRTKWIFYILLSAGILLQQTWIGLFAAICITGILVVVTRAPMRDLKKTIKPFVFFIFLSMLLAGIQIDFAKGHLSALGFSFVNAQNTGKQLFRIVLLIVLGMLLPLTTSHLKIKRGLEKSLSFLPWLKQPAEALALAVALMLRFIPMILKEVSRFSRIVRARGKSRTKPGSIRIRDVHVVMIPLLLSVFQLAENLSIAMEARGYKKVGMSRTFSTELEINRQDAATIIFGGVLLLALVVLDQVLK